MKNAVVLLILVTTVFAQLPDAPEPRYRLVDWTFVAEHAVYAGALAFDLTLTAERKPFCEEGSTNLGPHPGTGRIVGVGLAEFAGVTALDLGMKALARHNELPRWLGRTGGSVGAAIGIMKHVHGGISWERSGCL